jgi:hypothetical protein
MKAQEGSKNALPYHPISSMEWNSSVILGTAVAMIILSYKFQQVLASLKVTGTWEEKANLTNATKNTVAYTQAKIVTSFSPLGYIVASFVLSGTVVLVFSDISAA